MKTIKLRHLTRGIQRLPKEYVEAKERAEAYRTGPRRGQLLAEAKSILKVAKELGVV